MDIESPPDPDIGDGDPSREEPSAKRTRSRLEESSLNDSWHPKTNKRIKIEVSTDSVVEPDGYQEDDIFRAGGSFEVIHSNGGARDDNGGAESDGSTHSDKFYSQIIAMEEKGKALAQEKELANTAVKSIEINSSNSTGNSVREAEQPSRNLPMDSLNSDNGMHKNQLAHVQIKVTIPVTNQVILKNFESTLEAVKSFLKDHNIDLNQSDSGYEADVSAEITNSNVDTEISHEYSTRLAKSSLGSTIPRPSDASTLNRPSDASTFGRPSVNPNVDPPSPKTKALKREVGLERNAHQNRNTPLLSSTRNSEDEEDDVKESSTPSTENRDATKSSQSEVPKQSIKPLAHDTRTETTNLSSTSNSSFSTTSSSINIKVEPGEHTPSSNKRKAKGQTERNGIAMKAFEKFHDPSFVKSATLWGSIGNGAAVFARWRDKVYYSGKIEKRGQNDTWSIYFEDDMTDVASEAHILPIKILGVGTWTVYCPSDVFQPEDAIIAGQRFIDGTNDDLEKTEYALISDKDGRVIISNRKNLTLVENDARDMRKEYQVTITPKAADLSVENIVSGKRDRGAKTEPTPSSQIRAMVAKLDSSSKSKSSDVSHQSKKQLSDSSVQRTPTASRRNAQVQASNSKNSTPATTNSNKSTLPLVVEASVDDPVITPVIESSDTGSPHMSEHPRKLSFADSDSNSGRDDDADNLQIFARMYFFLTASGGVDPSSTIVVYDKEDLRRTIENYGGVVLDEVGAEARRRKNVFLISDNYARTVKYIYSLAAGIPCVSYNWITECCIKQVVVDYEPFELKAGFSIESEVVLPAHRDKPLKGFQIFVTSATDELYKYWRPVLQAAGAIIPKMPNVKKGHPLVPSHTDVVVTDNTCPLDVWEYARDKNIPIVKPEWLVQTIIAGKKVAFNGHDKYAVTELDDVPADD